MKVSYFFERTQEALTCPCIRHSTGVKFMMMAELFASYVLEAGPLVCCAAADIITDLVSCWVYPCALYKVDGKLSQKVVLAAKETASVKHFVLVTALGTGKARPIIRKLHIIVGKMPFCASHGWSDSLDRVSNTVRMSLPMQGVMTS